MEVFKHIQYTKVERKEYKCACSHHLASMITNTDNTDINNQK